ncbi:MAG: hypothetical protein L3J56_02875 [Bacteroidales bacterium]|nr:hypothetical protein [Bacteroidales bacterium]
MKILRFIPIILSFLLIAAHFSRAGSNILAATALLIPGLLFIKKSWVARIVQIYLVLGAAEWVRITFKYIDIRKQIGQDWTRLAVILIVVALFTLLAALIFQSKAMKNIYKIK